MTPYAVTLCTFPSETTVAVQAPGKEECALQTGNTYALPGLAEGTVTTDLGANHTQLAPGPKAGGCVFS